MNLNLNFLFPLHRNSIWWCVDSHVHRLSYQTFWSSGENVCLSQETSILSVTLDIFLAKNHSSWNVLQNVSFWARCQYVNSPSSQPSSWAKCPLAAICEFTKQGSDLQQQQTLHHTFHSTRVLSFDGTKYCTYEFIKEPIFTSTPNITLIHFSLFLSFYPLIGLCHCT